MKIKNVITIFLMVLTFMACSKDDAAATPEPDPDPIAENSAPEAFELLTPEEGAEYQPLRPEFSWEASIDPDGDTVIYDVYVGRGNEADSLMARGIVETHFTPTKDFKEKEGYLWKVIAKDGKGGEKSSKVLVFTVEVTLFLKQYSIQSGSARNTFDYRYDENNRLISMTLTNVDGYSFKYDAEDRLHVVQVIGSNDFERYHYDGSDRLIKVQLVKSDGSNSDTDLEYDVFGRIQFARLKKMNEQGEVTYEKLYHLTYKDTNTVLPFLITTETEYASNSNVSQRRNLLQWDANGNLTSRLVEVASDGGAFEFSSHWSYTYDQMPNPWHILHTGFRLPNIFYSSYTAFLDGIGFSAVDLGEGFYWAVKNNFLSLSSEINDQVNNTDFENYEYNTAGYVFKVDYFGDASLGTLLFEYQ